MYGWDDGNDINGDGCSDTWEIEDEWSWAMDPTLDNRSYWLPAWGSGVYDNTTESWDDGNLDPGDGWDPDCTIPSGFKWDQVNGGLSNWYPNCGDNIRDSFPLIEECDDGNNLNFDGCSFDWKIEPGYSCSYSTGVEICNTLFESPAPLFAFYDQVLSKIIIEFDQQMKNQSLNESSIQLLIEGPNGPYSTVYTTSFISNKFIVDFVVTPLLIGGIGENVKLELKDISGFRSNESIPILTEQVFSYTVSAFPVSASTKSSGQGASYTFILTIIGSLGVSILTGGSMELMWSLANTLQIIFFLGLLDLNYSSDLQNTFKIMGYSNFDNPLTKYVTMMIFFGINFINSPVNSKFGSLGFESTNILVNSFDKIAMITLLLIGWVITHILFNKMKDLDTRWARLVKKIDKSIRYESLARIVIELVLNLWVSGWINIWYGNTQKIEDIIAFIVSVVTLLGMLILLAYTIIYPIYYFTEIKGK